MVKITVLKNLSCGRHQCGLSVTSCELQSVRIVKITGHNSYLERLAGSAQLQPCNLRTHPCFYRAFKGFSIMLPWMRPSWFPNLFRASGNSEHVQTLSPERYLELATECISSLLILVQTSPENDYFVLEFAKECVLNQELCQYLAIMLLDTIQSTEMKIQTDQRPGTFKLLFRLAKEVESLIHSCSSDQWIQHAIMFTNMSEYVSSLACELDFCKRIMCNPLEFAQLTIHDLASRKEAEAAFVKDQAVSDQHRLLEKVKALLHTRDPSTPEWVLESYLLGRLTSPDPSMRGPAGSSSSNFWEVDYASLEQLQKLGGGCAGEVHKSVWLGELVAEKTFFGSDHPSFRNEVSILAGLSHPNIVPMFCYAMDSRRCSIVMELMEDDLFHLIRSRLRRQDKTNSACPFTIPEVLDIMLQVADGVSYLHNNKVVHRDLKSHNILVKSATDIDYVYVKVADFGLSKTKETSSTFSNQTLNTGTTRWMAPELMNISRAHQPNEKVMKYPFKSDVYSFAMVCHEILTGEVPFQFSNSHSDVRKMVLDGQRPELPDSCPDDLKTLIHSCWHSDAKARPSFDVICAELRFIKCTLLTGIPRQPPCSCTCVQVQEHCSCELSASVTMPEKANHSGFDKCNSCASTSDGAGLGPLSTVSHPQVCCLFKVARRGHSAHDDDGHCEDCPSRKFQVGPVYRAPPSTTSDAPQHGSPSRKRKTIEPPLKSFKYSKVAFEVRPPKFKAKLFFGTYSVDEFHRVKDGVNYYLGGKKPYILPDSPRIFAGRPLKGMKFEDLLPTCDQVINGEPAYIVSARQVSAVIHSVLGKQKKSAHRKDKYQVSTKFLLKEASQEVLDISHPKPTYLDQLHKRTVVDRVQSVLNSRRNLTK